MLVANTTKIVVVRILRHTPVEVRPSEDVLHRGKISEESDNDRKKLYHRILLVFNCPYGNFSKEVIV